MILLGGVVFHDRHQQVSTQLLRQMAKAVSSAHEPIGIGTGPAGMFATGGLAQLESTQDVLIAQDLDLSSWKGLSSALRRLEHPGRPLSALYRRDGWKFASRLRAGFVIALWDRRQHHLILAVDPYGIKRLHYVADDTKFAFATHPSSLMVLPGMERKLEPSVPSFSACPSVTSWIHRLQPGQVLILTPQGVKIERITSTDWSGYTTESLGSHCAAEVLGQ